MKAKYLIPILQGLCNVNPDINVRFKLKDPENHVKAALLNGDFSCIFLMDVFELNFPLEDFNMTEGGECMDNIGEVVLELKSLVYAMDIEDYAKEYDLKFPDNPINNSL